ncbi:MAG: hypothetical protein IT175_06105 [Acidobacteria bacterium]|nr:hypothetical protein [Acidobacteriota bacterium]
MKIIGCLSWYDESPSWLAATVTAAAKACDHMIAVDGAYALFPEAQAASSTEQHEAIQEAALAAGLGLTMHVPADVWRGNEVEKRSFMFSLALTVATPHEDWIFVLDADDVVRQVPPDFRERLAATELHVGGVTLAERHDPERWKDAARMMEVQNTWEQLGFRKLFRALPGLRVEGTHWTFLADGPDGPVYLWALEAFGPEEREDFCDLIVEHRSHQRPKRRQAQAQAYYHTRDAMAIEGHSTVLLEGLDGRPAVVR